MSEDDDWFERAFEDPEDDGESRDSGSDPDTEEAPDQPTASDSEGSDATDRTAASDADIEGEGAADWTSDTDTGPAGSATTAEQTGDWRDNIETDSSPFGGERDDDETDGDAFFDDDFASAFDDGPGGDFEEEEFDSDIPRIDLGIDGLDEMILGGVPERHLISCIGGAGSGKTTFGLQFLHHGLQNDQNGVFITLEQTYEDIMDTAAEHGWDFERHDRENDLAVVDLDPIEMANSLDNIRGELPDLITDFDADRLVLDSVSLLEMMYDDEARRRTEVFDFTRSLKRAGVTTFLTSEISQDTDYASRYGIIEYLTDAVFFLQYIRGDMQETRLAVEIQKIRNANHSRERKPYEITDGGISVYQQASIF